MSGIRVSDFMSEISVDMIERARQVGAQEAIIQLTLSGLLIPHGGNVLNAEQWSDFLNVIHGGGDDFVSRERLRLQFPRDSSPYGGVS